MNELKTGDIILFDYEGHSLFSSLIKKFTKSKFTHVGMILKDPKFIHPSLKGYYVWESGKEDEPDPQDNKKKMEYKLPLLQNYMKNIKIQEVKFIFVK